MQTLGLIALTFRELWAKKITLGLFIVSTLAWVLMSFALNLDIVEGSLAGIRIFGQDAGAPTQSTTNESGDMVSQMLQLETFVLAIESVVVGIAYWLATLLGLFATAPLLVSLLERGRIDLMLSKPLSRTHLLTGHILGVWLTVTALALYLLGMIWIVLGIKTGVWNIDFLLAVFVVLAMFAVMYSVVVCLGVFTQSTALSLIVSYGLIVISLIFLGKDQLVLQINPPWRQIFLGFYTVLPNFGEVTQMAVQLTREEPVTVWYPFSLSLAFGAALYGLAYAHFARRDF